MTPTTAPPEVSDETLRRINTATVEELDALRAAASAAYPDDPDRVADILATATVENGAYVRIVYGLLTLEGEALDAFCATLLSRFAAEDAA